MKISSFLYFFPERPVLLNITQPLFDELSNSPEWVAEPKYNGCRLQLHFTDGKWQFWNRHGARMDYRPDAKMQASLANLAAHLGSPAGYFLFDGELRHGKVPGVQHRIMLYDVFIWDDRLLLGSTFYARHNLLESLPIDMQIGVCAQYHYDFKVAFDLLTQDPEIEGLVMKNAHGVLDLGRTGPKDSKWMFKVRRANGSYRF